MITSISYLPNAVNSSSAAQAQADVSSQNPVTTQSNIQSSAIAQLSSFGQVKSSLADLQNKATALKALNQPPTFSDFQGVVQSFVQSFNALNQTINNASAKQAVLEADNPAKQALNEIRKATFESNQGGSSFMKGLGILQQENGALAINQPQLEKKFQDNVPLAVVTLADVSNRVSDTVKTQLSDNGFIGRAANDLSSRISAPGSAIPVKAATNPLPQSVPAQPATGSAVRNAVTTYAGVAAL